MHLVVLVHFNFAAVRLIPLGQIIRHVASLSILRRATRRHLRTIARKLIEMAEGGDLQAIKEVGDRLDGLAQPAEIIEHQLDFLVVVARHNGRWGTHTHYPSEPAGRAG